MPDEEIIAAFKPISERFETIVRIRNDPPLLAHYTSIPVLESVIKNNEIWFSNPLFMNDFQELRFGVDEGYWLMRELKEVADAAGDEARRAKLVSAFDSYHDEFANKGALDVYVFCLSEHDRDDNDGRLSMWRAYAAQGNGAALVFDTTPLGALNDAVPLFLTKVNYGSDAERRDELRQILIDCCDVLRTLAPPDEKLYVAAYLMHRLILLFSLTWKHCGFREESEWRIIFLGDPADPEPLNRFLGYQLGIRGVEPKLKLNFGAWVLPGIGLTLDHLLARIVLGPSVSSPLARKSIERMLDTAKRPNLKPLLHSSTIPFRPH